MTPGVLRDQLFLDPYSLFPWPKKGRFFKTKRGVEAVRVSEAVSVADILRQWPETARVFIRRGMACIGCVMAPFETLAEAADYYGIPPDVLRTEVESVIAPASETSEGRLPEGTVG